MGISHVPGHSKHGSCSHMEGTFTCGRFLCVEGEFVYRVHIHMWEVIMCGGFVQMKKVLIYGGDTHMWRDMPQRSCMVAKWELYHSHTGITTQAHTNHTVHGSCMGITSAIWELYGSYMKAVLSVIPIQLLYTGLTYRVVGAFSCGYHTTPVRLSYNLLCGTW